LTVLRLNGTLYQAGKNVRGERRGYIAEEDENCCSTDEFVADRAVNLVRCDAFLADAVNQGVELVVFPENVLFRGKDQGYRDSGSKIPGPVTDQLAALSRKHGVAVVWGAIVETTPKGFHNSCVFVSHKGELLGMYRKMHLFELYDGETPLFREANFSRRAMTL